jgi:leader peptidase (prepilin peptidase)/N-methyltransferase
MSTVLVASLYALFGLVIGSFLNVVILRHGARGIGGRSGCLSCGASLTIYDLVPVLSWVYLRGRCRQCGSGISVQYPTVEILTAVLFVIIGVSPLEPVAQIFSLIIIALFMSISVYDLKHTIIPDQWSYSLAFVALLSSSMLVFAHEGVAGLLSLAIAGPLCAVPLFLLWLISRGRWMGLGDAKLCLGIGWLLGVSAGFYAIFMAFVLGAIISVCILLPLPYVLRACGITRLGNRRVSFTMKSEIPFGPFLIVSTVGVWFMMIYGYDVSILTIFHI